MTRSLVVDIAVGVALGIVAGVCMLTFLAYLLVRGSIDDARVLAAFNAGLHLGSSPGSPVTRGPLPSQGAVVPAAPACRSGEVPGNVNGEAVCVGRTSGTVRRLGAS